MQERLLGHSGLAVSRLGLGTATWGLDTSPDEAAACLHAFREAGGTLVVTGGASGPAPAEEILGELLTAGERGGLVLAACADADPIGGRPGSRRALLAALDAALSRLGTDHVDLWQIGQPDDEVPLEESLSALDIALATGRARYVGASGWAAWRAAAGAATQRAWPGRAPITSLQAAYSLLDRSAEAAIVPAGRALGWGVLAGAPLAYGVLTGKYRHGRPADSRGASAASAGQLAGYLEARSSRIVDAALTAADGLGVSPVTVALCWVRDRPGVAAAVVGARTAGQLQAALAAERVVLPPEIRNALDDVSDPSGPG